MNADFRCRAGAWLVLALLITGCAGQPRPAEPEGDEAPPPVSEVPPVVPLLAYYQGVHRMSAQELGRERIVLAALPPSPSTRIRMAMVLGQPRGQTDLPRALSLLELVLKSRDPAAVSLHPLARLLADQYGDRQKIEVQAEKASQLVKEQLKESQRRVGELQEKLDALTAIEQSLPPRPPAGQPLSPGAPR